MNHREELKPSTNQTQTEELQLGQEFLALLNSEVGKVKQANKGSKDEFQKSQDSQKIMADMIYRPDDESTPS